MTGDRTHYHGDGCTRPHPEGDNHHNAGKCPHCTDNGRYKLIDPTDEAVVERVRAVLLDPQAPWWSADQHARAVLSALADGDTP